MRHRWRRRPTWVRETAASPDRQRRRSRREAPASPLAVRLSSFVTRGSEGGPAHSLGDGGQACFSGRPTREEYYTQAVQRILYTVVAGSGLIASLLAAPDPNAERFWAQWRGPYATGVSKYADPPLE